MASLGHVAVGMAAFSLSVRLRAGSDGWIYAVFPRRPKKS